MVAENIRNRTVQLNTYYPLGAAELFYDKNKYRVKATGEFRPPKNGEWYLSGAIVEAYRAHVDLSTPYHIGKLVSGKTVTRWVPDETVSDS